MANYTHQREDIAVIAADGRCAGNATVHHRFSRNINVGTTYVPTCYGGIYRTLQSGSGTKLRIKAGGNANDTANGSGAREITIEGVEDITGNFITEAIATNGTSASLTTTKVFMRHTKSYVSKSGTYASSSSFSHAGTITIENAAGTQDWAYIPNTSEYPAITQIACYSVPRGKKVFIPDFFFGCDDKSKVLEVVIFKRENILETAPPYSPMIQVTHLSNTDNTLDKTLAYALKFDELTDIVILARIDVGTAEVHVDFNMLEMDRNYNG